MADKETGLNITVGAVADENSARKAAKDLADGVLSSLKDGYIEVPAEIKVPIKNASKDLEKAQKDVINQWKKTFKEGFSSSAKDLDDLTEAYRKFKRLAGKEHKAGTKQYREISKLMSGQIQTYNTQKQARETKRAEQMAKSQKAKQRIEQQKVVPKSKEDIERERVSKAVQEKIKKQNARRDKRYLKIIGPKEYGSGWIDPGRTNTREAKLSEVSSYPSGMARQTRQSERESRKWMKDSLTSDKYATKEELEAEVKRRRESDKIQGSNKRKLSAMERAGQLSEDIRSNILPDLLGKIQSSTNEKEIETLSQKLFDTLEAVSTLNQDAGKSIFSDVKQNIGLIMGKLGFTSSGNIGGTEGGDKTEASRDPKMVAILKGLLDEVAQKEDAIKQELIKLEELEKKTISKSRSKTTRETDSFANRAIAEIRASKTTQAQTSKQIADAVSKEQQATENQTAYDKIENISERQADIQLETEQKATTEANKQETEVLESDADTGFNTNARAEKSIEKQSKTNKILNTDIKTRIDKILEKLNQSDAIGFGTSQSILETISANVELIANSLKITDIKNTRKNDKYKYPAIIPPDINKAITVAMKKTNLPDLYRYFKDGKWTTAGVIDHDKQKPTALHDATDWDKVRQKRLERDIETEREEAIKRNATRSNAVRLSSDLASAYNDHKVLRAIKNAFGIADTGPNANSILGMNQAQIEKLRAERLATFGIPRDNRATSNGDITQVQRRKSIYGWSKTGPNPFENLKLTDGIGIDSKGITDALQTAIQKNMFNAQTGGVMRNLLGSMSLYIGMPSLEKSRKEAEGLNSVMAEIRQVALGLLQVIQARETDLRGMEAKGTAKFDASGMLTSDSSNEAKTIFAQMEDSKMALRGVLADANMVEEVVQQTGGNVAEIIKRLGFAAPELRKCNTILQNMNAGLDQNGKALKFQTRTAEVMSYAFRLMARSVGQMIKRWAAMINPINLIKKAFSDFASYDVKWQRTMNVIKYNIRRIIRPFMEWLAQQIVNVVGLLNAMLKGVGKVFGKNWDLFDQSAASAEQMREELEQAANVTASFDELHDIGGESSSNPAMDLMGDIYTPQWEGLYEMLEKVGELIGNIFKAIKDFTKKYGFWGWLAIGGAALLGFMVLKKLINWFKGGKNPLQSVADGFSFLEKAVGWAILILAFTAFTKALTEFVECMKSADWEDIGKSLVMLGGALLELGLVLVALIGFAKLFGTTFLTSLGLAAVVSAFALFTFTLTQFINAVKGLTEDDIINALALLGGALLELTLVIITLSAVFTALVATGFGAIAIVLLIGVLAVVGLVILALAELVKAFKDCGDDIKLVLEGISQVVQTIGEAITKIISAIATSIVMVVEGVANSIMIVLTPILTFIDDIISKIIELVETIVHEVGDTIKNIVETVGNIIIEIIDSITNAVPRLLKAIVDFCGDIGPAIERTADSIMRTITKVVNFTVSAIEYLINLVISGVNSMISAINSVSQYVGINIPRVPEANIPRFVPQYKAGTNFVPNDGLAYLHRGEAVIPEKYNQGSAYQQTNTRQLEDSIDQLNKQVAQIGEIVNQGIKVQGQFVQKGTDLVASVEKTNNKLSNAILSNKVYAR